ncbi:hypothetical protein G6F37_011502 [Rhizopus arrhizus]|nr:hypothetical protein G6F37_011502 [Rhizopus arrhizus]
MEKPSVSILPILEHFRSQGFRISAYLDDWILAASTKQLAIQQVQAVVAPPQQVGWMVNFKKSVLTPTQQLEHLGFVLNTRTMTASLPMKKLRDIRRSIKQVLDHPHRQSPRVPGCIHGTFSTTRTKLSSRKKTGPFPHPGFSQHTGIDLVVSQPSEMERSLSPSVYTHPDHLCRRQRYGLGMQLAEPTSSWLLDSNRSSPIDQLAGTQGGSFGSQNLSGTEELNHSHQDGQHNQLIVYQQARWNSFSPIIGTSDRSLELVSSPQYNDPGSAYQRNSQHNGGHGVSSNLLQEPMADQTFCIRGAQQDMRSFYNQPLRRPNNEIIAKVRVLASGSGCYPHGCVFHPIDEANESLRKSSLESHFSDITEDQARTTPLHSSGGPLLAQRDLVPSVDQMALSRQLFLPPQAVETTSHKTANLNEQAIQDLFTQKLASNPTNKTYRKNQLRFLEWANHNWVSFTAFSGADLINFLATIRQTHNFQVATLKTIRAAVAYLHDNPPSISEDSSINSYLDSLSRQAPPVSIHREQVDMTPSLDYACSIPSQSGTSVKSLQQKLAFLLAMAAFLRPSNLARIPFSSCEVRESDGCLKFQVVYPKETRKKRRIIKPFTVHPHTRDRELYPVQCFIALRDHPDLQARPENSTLFIKSNNIRQPLSASTLSSWLHREFISLSTSESRVSIRSLTSSRALDEGVSMDHIVTLGNWVSSGTFQDHYQRNQMAMIDFTSTVLSGSNDDEFFDASDTFSLD